jgi:hypothetical protein
MAQALAEHGAGPAHGVPSGLLRAARGPPHRTVHAQPFRCGPAAGAWPDALAGVLAISEETAGYPLRICSFLAAIK